MYDTAVIGAGLAGLTTAALLARRGQRVLVLEKSEQLGGRGRTSARDGFHFNLGPRALYCRGEARRILDDLGVKYTGSKPPLGGTATTAVGDHPFPVSPLSWLTTDLFSASERASLARQLIRVGTASPRDWSGKSVTEYLDPIHSARVRQTLQSLFRLTSYANDPDRFDAGAALHQLKLAAHNVLYIDGGWQVLVDGLAEVARSHGAEIRTGERVCSLENIDARDVVIAGSPAVAASLSNSAELERFAASAVPAHAACLDIALSELPNPRTFALGLDCATYVSAHSATARLAPQGGAVIHALAYLREGQSRDPRAELEDQLDRIQPGWRSVTLHQRYLPKMVVTHALPTARDGGLRGRFGPAVPDVPGVFVAGDWVGPRGLLADAALASAEQVAEHLLVRAQEAA